MHESHPPPLQARQLSCRRGGRRLFAQLDLTLHPSEVLWLRGDNGRGKTSLLRLLAGLVEPEQGEVLWFGQRARHGSARPFQPLYVAHANALKDDLTVGESLVFLAELSGYGPAPTTGVVGAALDRLGMGRARDTLVRALSQGQRRRAALARLALPSSTRVWLLDEPYDALDQVSITALNGLLSEHVRAGGAVVLTSHQPLGDDAPAHTACWLQPPARTPANASTSAASTANAS